jgi:hypothetical protein
MEYTDAGSMDPFTGKWVGNTISIQALYDAAQGVIDYYGYSGGEGAFADCLIAIRDKMSSLLEKGFTTLTRHNAFMKMARICTKIDGWDD